MCHLATIFCNILIFRCIKMLIIVNPGEVRGKREEVRGKREEGRSITGIT